jgi:hypothetical protein
MSIDAEWGLAMRVEKRPNILMQLLVPLQKPIWLHELGKKQQGLVPKSAGLL